MNKFLLSTTKFWMIGLRNYSEVGKNKLSSNDALVDKFGRRHTYLRISLTEKCNLRCMTFFLNFIMLRVI